MTNSLPDFDHLMTVCLEQAKLSAAKGEVPIGAVVFRGGEILASAHNLTETLQDPTAHAEMLAIREACKKINNWRLEECGLCVTVEPCTQCFGAIIQSRISTVVFGAKEERTGACGSLYDLSLHQNPTIRVVSGICEVECRALMQEFFRSKRV